MAADDGLVRRAFRLWRLYGWLDFQFFIQDPKRFTSFMLADALWVLPSIATALLLAERFQGIGPWTKPGVLFLCGYAVLVNGIESVFFGYNVAYISRRVGRGQLDHVLVQPQPVWLTLLTEGFAPFSAGVVALTGAALLAGATVAARVPVTAGWLALLALNLAASTAVGLSFSYLWGSLAFWAPRGAEEISTSAQRLLYELKSYPLDPLRGVLAGGLISVVPVGFVAWYPCGALLGLRRDPLAPFVTPLAALALGALAAAAFRWGMRHYARTGSQRYLALGHRS